MLCFLGLFGVLNTVLPIPAIVPILLYIGLLIGAQAFQSVPRIQAAAVVAAILPNLGFGAEGLAQLVLLDSHVFAGNVARVENQDLAGVRGLIVDFAPDRVSIGVDHGDREVLQPFAAAVGAALSFIGLIHAAEVSWAADPQVALGYAMLAIVLCAFAFNRRGQDDSVTAAEEMPAEA